MSIPPSDRFGLAGTFPRPGWVVLDAARERRFTGELVFPTTPEVRVYLDRGRIYLAERVTDPTLGARLVDAGALNAAQLEHGSILIGGAEHLGRLFERVPSVDRHAVLVTAELMTDECVGWLANQVVRDVGIEPYLHHPSGVHRWELAEGWMDLSPGDPLPAPAPDASPVELSTPEPLFEQSVPSVLDDDMIQWDQPSFLDRPEADAVVAPQLPAPPVPSPFAPPAATFAPPPQEPAPAPAVSDLGPLPAPAGSEVVPPPVPVAATPPPPPPLGDLSISDDWIDRLEAAGVPEVGGEDWMPAKQLPRLPVERTERFELIWPSGEIDEQFGSTDFAEHGDVHPDFDRVGPTAKVSRAATLTAPPPPAPEPAPMMPEQTAPVPDDDVVLAVRRAVASIETGSITARRRLADAPPDEDLSRGTEIVPPGRVAVRVESIERQSTMMARTPTRSVFDDAPTEAAVSAPESRSVEEIRATPPAVGSEVDADDRSSALRRLIGSLRRRDES